MEKRKGGLGKGLGSLIPDAIKEPTVQQVVVSAIQELPLADIRPNPHAFGRYPPESTPAAEGV